MIVSSRSDDRVPGRHGLFGLELLQVTVALNESQDRLGLRQQIPVDLSLLDKLSVAVVARKFRHGYSCPRKQFVDSLVLSKQHKRRNRREELVRGADGEEQILLQKVRCLIKIRCRVHIFERTRERP